MTSKDWTMLRILFPYVSLKCEITNKKDIKYVIDNTAYKDMMPRTIKGLGSSENQKYKDAMLKYVYERIIAYFEKPALDKNGFENWHIETCTKMIECFKGSELKFAYGKAQKLLNIVFKNLLLFKGAKEEYFTYCHTPIDNNVLYLCRTKAGIKCRPNNWSAMDKNEYLNLQNDIRNYLDSDRNIKYRFENEEPISNLVFDYYAWIEGDKNETVKKYWLDVVEKSEFYTANKEIIDCFLNNYNT